jgi:hypothetical protein
MCSQASIRFSENKKDIEILWHIYAEVSGEGKSRKRRADVVNRASIVFISACWESYIEDVAMEAFDYLLIHASTPDTLPAKVKTLAAKELREAKDERRIWELAESGWRKILKGHRDNIREKWLKDFNTPKSKQVSELFANLIDLRDVTSNWSWPEMSADQARSKLDEYVTIRGNIAHRTKHNETIYKSRAKDFLSHVVKLVEKTDEAISDYLQSLTTEQPGSSGEDQKT